LFPRQHRIPALNRIERSQDRVLGRVKTVAPHPLDFANPHADPCQFRRIGVQFDAQHAFRAHTRKTTRQAKRLGIQIRTMLQVF
jgi:hypothetical protein